MSVRLINGLGVITLLGCLAWLLAARTEPVLQSADALRGEAWYRLLLDQRHVGYLHTRTARDPLGRWSFDSDLRFVLSAGHPVRIEEHLLFDGTPGFVLLHAEQRLEHPDRSEGTRIERSGGGYQALRLAARSRGPSAAQPLDLGFALGDYLGFETRLRRSAAPAGSLIASSAIDFERRRVVARQFRVSERNATGYLLENPAPLNPTTIQLDAALRPVRMTLSGLFDLERATREQALAPRTALQAGSYFVPTDRPLPNHTRVRTLALEVSGAVAGDLWPGLAEGQRLERRADAVSDTALRGDELAETAEHPISDARVRALAERAVAGIEAPGERIDALTHFVHGYLRYTDEADRPVLDLLDEPVGDCSEYADLLTTLARSLGIPSRTVFGLAYADGPPPAFRFHAWNELRLDGGWRVVDPTWDQLRVDATHIPLPGNVARALELLTGNLDIGFVIREVEYD